MTQEPLPPEIQNASYEIQQNILICHAWDIVKGQASGEYIYSLEEDYVYVYEDNYWKKILDKEFLSRVESKLTKITTLSLAQRKEIIENFKIKKHMRIEGFNNTSFINFKNCMFNPSDQARLPHRKEYYSTIRIPYIYDTEIKCELWLKTLDEILQGNKDKISSFQEFVGYCLLPETNQKKALLLLGESNSGKSTLLFIVKDLLGAENVSNVPLQYLSNPQYTPLLINKMVNIDADVAKDAAKYEREFKIITTGEAVSCNQKHIPTFEFVPKCKIILAANEFPRITDRSNAFYNRLILIPCDRVFEEREQNKNLVSELRKELPGIFNWAIEGLNKFKKRGNFEKHDFMKEAITELENENNPSNLFFDEHIEIVHGSEMEKGILFERYQMWAKRTNTYILSSARFSTAVYKRFSSQTTKNAQSMETRKRIWRNIKYVDFKTEIRGRITEEEI